MNVKFLGAAKNVTGSKFLLNISNKQILVDCGLFQEWDLKKRNWEKFPVSPESIDAIIITHAHLDHCGYLPKIVKDGFKGKIFCTEPTAEIIKILLLDAGKIQEEDAIKKRFRHKNEERKGPYPELPLYTVEDAKEVFPLLLSYPYNSEFEVADGITVCFHDAGHILGSAMIELKVSLDEGVKKIIFSGDIGRWNKPILNDPTLFNEADIVFMESTYGDRLHRSETVEAEKLAEIINRADKAGGNVVIPVFAIERAQELLYFLNKFLAEDIIPHIFTFMDSPMAINVTEVFEKYPEYFDDKTRKLIEKGDSPFDFPLLESTRTVSESKSINHVKGSAIIMAGSGMCTGGRIKHHLISNITRKESSIVFVGYQAKGTLGRQILEKPKTVRILGRQYTIKANIEDIEGFSAHADKNELFKWVKGFKKEPEKIFITHGEEEVAEEFASFLRKKIKSEIITPEYMSEFTF